MQTRSFSLTNHYHFGLESLPVILVPPTVFGGLLVTLWAYKCLMMVVFQNKIIYMPSVPPFSRSEKISDYAAQCKPVIWTDHSLRAADGTAIKVVEGTVDLPKKLKVTEDIVIVYFQGYVTLSSLVLLSNAFSAMPLLCLLAFHTSPMC